MKEPVHIGRQYPTRLRGVEAMSMTSARSFPRHSHDQLGIGVMTAGGHRSWSSIGWVEASVGDVIMANPGEIHDGEALGGQARSWKMLYFDEALLLGEFDGIVRPTARDTVQARQFSALFATLLNPMAAAMRCEELTLQMLGHTFARHGMDRPVALKATPGLSAVVRLLENASAVPACLADLAAIVGLSRFQLLRAFAKATGSTPHQFLMQERVKRARRLLASGLSPAEAGLRAGFSDQSHMTRSFVRQLGVTPGQYRACVAASKGYAGT